MISDLNHAVHEPIPAVEVARKVWIRPTVKPVGELKDSVQQGSADP